MPNILKFILCSIVLSFFLNCHTEKRNIDVQFYSYFGLKDDRNISHLKGDYKETFPEYMNSGYFTYEADDDWFDFLKSNDKFPTEIIFNHEFYKTKVDYDIVNHNTSFYTEYIENKKIIQDYDIENKVMYYGTYFPYAHTILYDTITHKAIHFVSGMSE